MSDPVVSPDPRPLGKSGVTVSPIAWGMWRFAGRDPKEAQALVEAALAAGITLFDTADIYGFDGADGFGTAEGLLGHVLRDAPGLREKMVLATKGGIAPPIPYDSSAAYLKDALDASLKRMGVDRVELYQIHRPDLLAHPQEVARALEDMITAGKAAAIGVSNYTRHQITALQSFLSVPLAAIQPEFSPLATGAATEGLFDLAMEHDLAVLAWSPLAGGRLASPDGPHAQAIAGALDHRARDSGVSRAAVIYSWIMAHPARPIPIVGSQRAWRIAEAADAFKVSWTRRQWYEVLVAARGEALP